MRKLGTGLISISVLLSACAGMGPRPVVTRVGAVDDEVRRNILRSGPIYNFVQAELAARPYSSVTVNNGTIPQATRLPNDPAKIRDMLDTGFTAIYASCDDFFRSSGRDQTRLLVLRDIIVALSSLAGGALAVIDGNGEMGGQGNENALAAIALGSTAALSGVDIYTQRFLFGAENIDAVRELTTRALETHRSGVLFPTTPGVTPPATYDRVLVHLMDNQAKCSPRAISRLARDAIAAGNLAADSGQGSLRTQQNQTQDQRVLAELGRVLDMAEPLTEEQAGALWWLLLAEGDLAPKDPEIAGAIKTALTNLPAARQPIGADGKRKNPWAPEQSVRQILRGMSEPTLRGFRLAVTAARQAAVPAPVSLVEGAVPAAPGPVVPRFRIGVQPTASTDQRVTVRVVSPD